MRGRNTGRIVSDQNSEYQRLLEGWDRKKHMPPEFILSPIKKQLAWLKKNQRKEEPNAVGGDESR